MTKWKKWINYQHSWAQKGLIAKKNFVIDININLKKMNFFHVDNPTQGGVIFKYKTNILHKGVHLACTLESQWWKQSPQCLQEWMLVPPPPHKKIF